MSETDGERLERLLSIVRILPEAPGSYQYYDREGRVIYVGKAKNLRKRVSQYFMKRQQSSKTTVLVSKIHDIKHIVVGSEEDALLLENNLIKKYKPRYNILLKDDKTYPWIAILNEPFPRVVQTRRHVRDGSVYYGPYPSVSQVRDLFGIFKELFPLRTCALSLDEERIRRGAFKVCLKYHLHLCEGPCEGHVSADAYAEHIAGVRSILRGGTAQLLRSLKAEMAEAAEELEFERAEELRKKIERLSAYQAKSVVASNSIINADVFFPVRADDRAETYVNFMRVQDGQVTLSYTLTFTTKLDEPLEEVLTYAVQSVRETHGVLQREVVVPFMPDTELSGVLFAVPKSGERRKLLELSEKNVRLHKLEVLKREAERMRASREDKLMIQIKEMLGLSVLPQHIECFDNSNLQGSSAVAACVVYRGCKPSKQDYRLFNIKTVEGPNDYASMREVVFRRYSRLQEEGLPMPDLVVADGGVGQMQMIREATESLGLSLNIIGLAKDSHHRTSQILVGFPPKVVGVGRDDSVFRFFTRMQDEVHRVAIAFHRSKRSKVMVTSELDGVSGLGPKTKERLFKEFHGIDGMRSATLEELVSAVGRSKAEIVYGYFHGGGEVTE